MSQAQCQTFRHKCVEGDGNPKATGMGGGELGCLPRKDPCWKGTDRVGTGIIQGPRTPSGEVVRRCGGSLSGTKCWMLWCKQRGIFGAL